MHNNCSICRERVLSLGERASTPGLVEGRPLRPHLSPDSEDEEDVLHSNRISQESPSQFHSSSFEHDAHLDKSESIVYESQSSDENQSHNSVGRDDSNKSHNSDEKVENKSRNSVRKMDNKRNSLINEVIPEDVATSHTSDTRPEVEGESQRDEVEVIRLRRSNSSTASLDPFLMVDTRM